MSRNRFVLVVMFVGVASTSWAQRGGRGAPPPAGSHTAPVTEEEAKKAKLVDEIRTTLPQHPPIAKNPWPSKNAQMLGRLVFAEQPRADLNRYLEGLWNQNKEPLARRAALDGLWEEAEKPKWARAAIEEFFRQHANGVELRLPSDPTAISITRLDQLDAAVGKLVTLRGSVTNTKIATLLGVDVESETPDLRGQAASVTGILGRRVVTQADLDRRTAELGSFANRGPGTFYTLIDPRTGRVAQVQPPSIAARPVELPEQP